MRTEGARDRTIALTHEPTPQILPLNRWYFGQWEIHYPISYDVSGQFTEPNVQPQVSRGGPGLTQSQDFRGGQNVKSKLIYTIG